jgi:HEAT repeat protein
MTRRDEYRCQLEVLAEWDDFLLANSGLPGPRGNLELAHAAADAGTRERFARYLEYDEHAAPTNDPHEFLAFCGVLGMGRLLAEGDADALVSIRRAASDGRWRLREACAQALQRLGDVDMDALCAEVATWANGNLLERRAAVAAICEPRLLAKPAHARFALDLLDRVTAGVPDAPDRRAEDFAVLRKGLAYCWSVAVVALPEEGKNRFERWLDHENRDVRWIVVQNLKKARLVRLDPDWTNACRERLDT